MANPTTNFGWQMPEPTDLVTDLPADFEVFGQAVDTDFVDLLGGTTGQVLSKTSNTDLDFTWVAATAGMTNPLTTTGDTIYSSSGSTPARLGIGSASQVLTVSGGGIPSWATPAAAGFTFTAWTPTFTNISVGNGSYTARYGTSGKFTHFEISFLLGSTSSVSNGAKFSLPTTPKTTSNAIDQYTFSTYLDSGNAIYFGASELTATTCDLFMITGNVSYVGRVGVSATVPFTWGNGDEFFIAGNYEEA
jgi:hypothetical protein